MTNEEFAKNYAGLDVRVYEKQRPYDTYNGLIGRIIGYSGNGFPWMVNGVFIEPYDKITNGYSLGDVEYLVVGSHTIKNQLYYFSTDNLIPIWQPSPSKIPDDCLECNARGNDPCKEWCPNK